MFNDLLAINPAEEVKRITSFIKNTFSEQKIEKAVVGISGGVDSATSLFLLSRCLPLENILAVNLPYFEKRDEDIDSIIKKIGLPSSQLINHPINESADLLISKLDIPKEDLVRRGNIMARVRMVALFDFAKRNNAMVVGTENRSEYHLGYFTRFGDEASDIEPLQHLYKTQVFEIAKYLEIPDLVLNKKPSANLWNNQTDEEEFGFSYKDADPVLFLYFDKKNPVWTIEKMYPNARKIIDFAEKNSYKHRVPYRL